MTNGHNGHWLARGHTYEEGQVPLFSLALEIARELGARKPSAKTALWKELEASMQAVGVDVGNLRVPSLLEHFADLMGRGIINPKHPHLGLRAPSPDKLTLECYVSDVEACDVRAALLTEREPVARPERDGNRLDASVCEQALRVVTHSTKLRRHTLDPVIEMAQSQCRNPFDVAEVWAALSVLADKKHGPLLGATEDGIQWLKDGDVAFYSKRNLSDKLRRQKKSSKPR